MVVSTRASFTASSVLCVYMYVYEEGRGLPLHLIQTRLIQRDEAGHKPRYDR